MQINLGLIIYINGPAFDDLDPDIVYWKYYI